MNHAMQRSTKVRQTTWPGAGAIAQAALLSLAILAGTAAGGLRGPDSRQGLAPAQAPTSADGLAGSQGPASAQSPAAPDLGTTEIGARFVELGRFGGRMTAIALGEGVVYAGMGRRLGVFTVSPAGDWTLLGSSETLAGSIRSLVVSDGHVFAGLWDPPLLVSLNVADPRQPRVLATLNLADADPFFRHREPHVNDLALAGDRLYATLLSGVAIVDVRDPAHPRPLGAIGLGGTPFFRVDPSGSHGFGSIGNRLGVITLADPAQPNLVSQLRLPVEIVDIALQGSLAYVVGSSFSDGSAILSVVDIRNPRSPILVHEAPLGIGSGLTLRLAASAGHLYMVASELSFGTITAATVVLDLDLADPAAPVDRSRHMLPPERPDAVAIRDGMAYLALGEKGLATVDLRQPGAAEVLGRYELPRPASGYAASDGWAYAATRDGFMVLDIRDPRQPRVAATYASPAADEVTALVLEGDRLYLTYRNGGSPEAAARPGLAVIDVTDPRLPRELGFFRTPYNATAVTVAGDLAFLVAGPGLRVVDLSDLARPREVGAYRTAGVPVELVVRGSRAYVASSTDFGAALEIIDLENPAALRRLSTTGIGNSGVSGLAVADETAYVLLGDQGLRVLDVSDPLRPVAASSAELPIFGRASMRQQGRHLYVAQFSESFDFVQQQVIVHGGVFLSVFEVGNDAPRLMWQTTAFGSPVVADGLGLAEGADGELVMLLPLGPPQAYLPAVQNGEGAVPTPEADLGSNGISP